MLKTSKKVYEVMFFDTYKYIYSESVFNALPSRHLLAQSQQ